MDVCCDEPTYRPTLRRLISFLRPSLASKKSSSRETANKTLALLRELASRRDAEQRERPRRARQSRRDLDARRIERSLFRKGNEGLFGRSRDDVRRRDASGVGKRSSIRKVRLLNSESVSLTSPETVDGLENSKRVARLLSRSRTRLQSPPHVGYYAGNSRP